MGADEMISSKAIRIAGPLTGVAAALLMAGPASAAPSNPFGCRASVQGLHIASLPAVEPSVANPAEDPCATDSVGANQSSTGSTAAGSTSAGPSGAYTVSDDSSPGATALASVDGGTVAAAGNAVALTGQSNAQASYVCVSGTIVASGASDVSVAVINGQTIRPSSPGAETTTQLGGGSYATINQQVQSATSLTERLVFVHIAGVGDYVLGEAQVTRPAGNPCPGGTGTGGAGSGGGGSGSGSGGPGSGGSGSGSGGSGSGSGNSLKACPDGSVLVAAAQMCEIVTAGGSVAVSAPFAGPTGGSVMTLAAARKKYKSSCLSGTGPKFVVVGTNKANKITAAKTAERILALGGNDKITIKSGASCVDGGAGRDTISGGTGKVRLFGGAGNDKLTAKNGSSYINGGNGADRITVGNGRDRVFGGAGKDIITVGKGKDHVFGGAGNDRLHAAGRIEYVNGGKGKDVAYVAAKEMKYAHRHGCEKVHRIPAKH
jgi:Ca2+-binding RTX toxin-like protein